MKHWYYLHTNGELIHKRTDPGEDRSDFVRRVWPCDLTDRANAWTILTEALALGARTERIRELAEKWSCDSKDLVEFVRRATPTPELKLGVDLFIDKILLSEHERWWDWLGSTPKGSQPDFSTMPVGVAVNVLPKEAP